MTQEEKQLLLQDLCTRLPCGVICSTPNGNGHLCSINQTIFGNEYGVNIEAIKRDHFNDNECDIKPYLRLMSSMTEEEAREYANCGNIITNSPQNSYLIPNPNCVDWLNAHHFDYRGLIERGLAIEVTEENNPYKE